MHDDIFEKIITREIPAKIIYEDEKFIAFEDIKPVDKGHFLVTVKNHATNLYDIDDQALSSLILKARELALKRVKELGATGFNLIINNNLSADQTIFRIHVHIIPRY